MTIPIVQVLVVIVVVGVVVWLINTYAPMDKKFKVVFNAILLLGLCIYLLQLFGVFGTTIRFR